MKGKRRHQNGRTEEYWGDCMAEGGEDTDNGTRYSFYMELEVRKPRAHKNKQAADL